MTAPQTDPLVAATSIPGLTAPFHLARLVELDRITRSLTIFDLFEALATNNGRIDETGNGYRPTLRADRDPRYTLLADAYDAYQIARGDPKRAIRE